MRKVVGLLLGLIGWTLATPSVWAVNHVTVESKSVALGATGVQVGVFLENDVSITAITIPLDLRSITPGTYVTSSFTYLANTAGRVHNSPLGAAGANWPAANVTNRKYPDTGAPACSGPISNTYQTSAAQINFISPDGVFHAAVSTGDPNAGEDISMPAGSDPAGTPSLIFTFNVTSVDGLFEIDTCCVRPANHLAYVDEGTIQINPTFTKSVITVGNPVFPPVVTDIPDQTINEGQSFATINLDDYVSDLDDPDAALVWTASGQSQLSVSISPARVATISTPNPDYFGSETIQFKATDPDGNADSNSALFTVNPVNDPPVLANITNKFRLAGQLLNFTISGSDIDNLCGDLSFSMVNAPGDASLSNDAPCGATFNWGTVCLDSGVYVVTFIVSDGALADSQVVTITIQPNPDRFDVNPDSLEFTFAVGQNEPDPQTLTVLDPGCGEMDFAVSVSQPWILVNPDTAQTTAQLAVSIDTAGFVPGNYTGMITLTRVNGTETIQVLVKLEVTQEICDCSCHADPLPYCDGVYNIQNIIQVINVAFRGDLNFGLVTCPATYFDANCDCEVNALDVVRLIDYIWRAGAPLCNPCEELQAPCGPPAGN